MSLLTALGSLAAWIALFFLSPTALVVVALLGSLVMNK